MDSEPRRISELFHSYECSVGQLTTVVRYVAYCRRHVSSLPAQALGEDPPAAVGEEYESGSELEEVVNPADPGLVDYAPRPKN